MDETLPEEKDLLLLIAHGDELAFAKIVQKYWRNIYSHALTYLKSALMAEEITQDVFIRLWNARSALPEVRKFDDYLFIIARNCIISGVRKKLKTPAAQLETDTEEKLLLPDQQLEYKEHYQLLLNGIELLPDKRKQVFKMSRLDGLTHEEIARELNIHKDTVAQYIVKAVNFLRTYLRSHINNPILIIVLLAGGAPENFF
ncbi:RNA polymerase sigma factor [Chitinophaga defluvii]|uniref:Sigma-70 family RNA polymerase sigma factor n=1 Tax=Chitinophaga defluvii TaxID=3163343 RepID=A0ABV2T0S3_9BACT